MADKSTSSVQQLVADAPLGLRTRSKSARRQLLDTPDFFAVPELLYDAIAGASTQQPAPPDLPVSVRLAVNGQLLPTVHEAALHLSEGQARRQVHMSGLQEPLQQYANHKVLVEDYVLLEVGEERGLMLMELKVPELARQRLAAAAAPPQAVEAVQPLAAAATPPATEAAQPGVMPADADSLPTPDESETGAAAAADVAQPDAAEPKAADGAADGVADAQQPVTESAAAHPEPQPVEGKKEPAAASPEPALKPEPMAEPAAAELAPPAPKSAGVAAAPEPAAAEVQDVGMEDACASTPAPALKLPAAGKENSSARGSKRVATSKAQKRRGLQARSVNCADAAADNGADTTQQLPTPGCAVAQQAASAAALPLTPSWLQLRQSPCALLEQAHAGRAAAWAAWPGAVLGPAPWELRPTESARKRMRLVQGEPSFEEGLSTSSPAQGISPANSQPEGASPAVACLFHGLPFFLPPGGSSLPTRSSPEGLASPLGCHAADGMALFD